MGSPHSPAWTSDAWFLLQRAGGSLNWTDVVAVAKRGHRTIPLLVALEYLAGQFQAPIPEKAIQVLRGSSREQDAIDSARAAALMSAQGRPFALLRAAGDGGAVAQTAWWMLFPPPRQLRMVEGAGEPLLTLYLKRLARFAVRPSWRM